MPLASKSTRSCHLGEKKNPNSEKKPRKQAGKTSKKRSEGNVTDSLRPHGPYSPWNSPGQNTGVGSLSLLQGIFPTQGLSQGLLHCRQILYLLIPGRQDWRVMLLTKEVITNRVSLFGFNSGLRLMVGRRGFGYEFSMCPEPKTPLHPNLSESSLMLG